MRVVAVSMVKNEADAIEPFCRHVAAFADRHLIFDHQSTDGTTFLLQKLAREGLPLTFFTDDRVEYLQAARTTELMRRAVRDFQADWVVPLDADEFPQPGPPLAFRSRLERLSRGGRPIRLWLKDHAPHQSDDRSESNPVLRLRHRFPFVSASKVFVPGALAADPTVSLGPGNHVLLRNGTALEPDQLDDVWLAHFPARTASQVVGKIVLNELQRIAGGVDSGGGTHLRRHFERLLTAPRMYFDSPEPYIRGQELAPASYWGEPLRYSVPVGEWDRAAIGLLSYAEGLAASHGTLRDAAGSRIHAPRLRDVLRRWFGMISKPVAQEARSAFREGLSLPDSRTAVPAGCELALLHASAAADRVDFTVRVRNTGLCIWRAGSPGEPGAVNLGIQLCVNGRQANPDFSRHPLPRDMEPGDEATLNVSVPHPPEAGAAFRLDMLTEGVSWFDHVGCEIDLASLRLGRAAA